MQRKQYHSRSSAGVILVQKLDKQIYYLLVRRRNSYAYVDLVCGRYNCHNNEYIIKLCLQLTAEERVSLQHAPFLSIWRQLWVHIDSASSNYQFAESKFNTLKHPPNKYSLPLRSILRRLPCVWADPEWGFPKGKPEYNEGKLACALREMKEETNLTEDDLLSVASEPVVETLVGTNGLNYTNYYFIGQVKHPHGARLDKSNNIQSQEIGDLGWFTYEDAIKKFRSYEESKMRTLRMIHQQLTRHTA